MKRFKPLIFLVAICTLPYFSLTAKADKQKDKDNNGKGHAYAYGHDKKETNKVPINGGIALLIAAGAALGAKRVFKKNQKNTPVA